MRWFKSKQKETVSGQELGHAVKTEADLMRRWYAGKAMMLAMSRVSMILADRFGLHEIEAAMTTRRAAVAMLTAEFGLTIDHATAKVRRVLQTEDTSRPDAVHGYVRRDVAGAGVATQEHLYEAANLMCRFYVFGAIWVVFMGVMQRAEKDYGLPSEYKAKTAASAAMWMLRDEFGLSEESAKTKINGILGNGLDVEAMSPFDSKSGLPIGFAASAQSKVKITEEEINEAVSVVRSLWLAGSIKIAMGLMRTLWVIQHGLTDDEARHAALDAAIAALIGEFELSEEAANAKVEEVLNDENTMDAAARMIVMAAVLHAQANPDLGAWYLPGTPSLGKDGGSRRPHCRPNETDIRDFREPTSQRIPEAERNMSGFWVAGAMVTVIQGTVIHLESKFGLPKEDTVRLVHSAFAKAIEVEFGFSYEDAHAKVDAILGSESIAAEAKQVTIFAGRLFDLADPKLAKEVMGFTVEGEDRERWAADDEVMHALKSLINETA